MTETASTLSQAHELSRFAIVDPMYDAGRVFPEGGWIAAGTPWIYGPTELVAWRHQKMRDHSLKTMGGDVSYSGVFHTAYAQASFRLSVSRGFGRPFQVKIRAVGRMSVYWNDRLSLRAEGSEDPHEVDIPSEPAGSVNELRIDLATGGEPPGLWIEDGPLKTGRRWEWRTSDLPWQPVAVHPQHRSLQPPHRVDEPEIELVPLGREGDLIDFGRELFARPVLRSRERPSVTVGESLAEARNDGSRRSEYKYDLIQTGENTFENRHPLGFRYLRIHGEEPYWISCRASFHPVRYRGAFACSSERLTQIWMTAAYTLRLCLHEFILDGIKRDCLPWVGDLAMSLGVDAYAFADAEIVRRSLTVLGRAGIAKGEINGIVDYSFWWVISHDLFQLYFDDPAYLASEWPRIHDVLEHGLGMCDSAGLARPPADAWIFVDWVEFDKTTALQVVWFWAQQAGIRLAQRIGDAAMEARLEQSAATLREALLHRSWDPAAEAWCASPDKKSPPCRHSNFLAVMSGLAQPEQYPGILAVLKGKSAPPVGTPYMAGFENAALVRLGDTGEAFRNIEKIWGSMLDRGATSFWEGFDEKKQGDEVYEFYGRPFGNSLCHAWSAGPAWMLPAEVLGIRPLSDGWRRFAVAPRLGSLTSAHACVPTAHGDIHVECENGKIRIQIPAGSTLLFAGREYPGPQMVEERL